MSSWGQVFWSGVALACLLWYSTITFLVAYRGAFDIRGMLHRLREEAPSDPQTNSKL
jgi:hypothetical protein